MPRNGDPMRMFYVAIEVALRETAMALEHEMEEADGSWICHACGRVEFPELGGRRVGAPVGSRGIRDCSSGSHDDPSREAGQRGGEERAPTGHKTAHSRVPLTDEQLRILRAIHEGRMRVEGGPRPDRKSRERLRGRGLIAHYYEQGRSSHWRVTAKGKQALNV